jgi:hypothetical protein
MLRSGIRNVIKSIVFAWLLRWLADWSWGATLRRVNALDGALATLSSGFTTEWAGLTSVVFVTASVVFAATLVLAAMRLRRRDGVIIPAVGLVASAIGFSVILSAESRLLDLVAQFAACPGCAVTDVPTNAAATPAEQIAQAARLVWAYRQALWSFILYGLFCLVAHRLGVCVRRLCWQFSRVAAGGESLQRVAAQ